MFDLGIMNGRIYIGGIFTDGNLYVKGGRIAAVSSSCLEAMEEYDAAGRMVLPGFIDPHVHLSMRGQIHNTADTFATGTAAAAYGGITTVIDFLDCAPNASGVEKAFVRRMEQAKSCVTDYAFHASVSNPSDDSYNILHAVKNLGIATIKLYTTYKESNSYTPDGFIDAILCRSSEEKVRILVHAENDSMLRKTAVPVAEHSQARPVSAETSEVVKLAQMAKYRGGLLYLVHISAGSTLVALKESFGTLLGRNILIESCPHYFTLDSAVYGSQDGCLYTMAPPLRSEYEQSLLKHNVDLVDVIGTDHCSFYKRAKQEQLTQNIPMGVGGLESSFKLMYDLFGAKIIDKYTVNVAKSHGLYPQKGTLLPGADADIVIFDDKTVSPADGRHSACDYSIYEGINTAGKIDCTILRGHFTLKDGRLCPAEGCYVGATL